PSPLGGEGGNMASLLDDGEDVLLAHQEDVRAAPALAELIARPGGEQDGVADLHLQGPTTAVLEQPARADPLHLAGLRLVLGGLRQVNAAGSLLRGLHPPDNNTVSQWFQSHRTLPRVLDELSFPWTTSPIRGSCHATGVPRTSIGRN